MTSRRNFLTGAGAAALGALPLLPAQNPDPSPTPHGGGHAMGGPDVDGPGVRDRTTGRLLDPPVLGGLAAGVVVMYATGLLVAA